MTRKVPSSTLGKSTKFKGGSLRNLTIELRPKSFDEVVGNRAIVNSIQKQLAGRVPVGWLLSGPPGTGKTTLAELIASKVGQVLDNERVNCAVNNGVDWHRQLVEKSYNLPWNGIHRAFILNEAQQLTNQAQQVWLDPLEDAELPSVIIFTTTEPEKLLEALRQRCVWHKLSGIEGEDRQRLVDSALKASGSDRRWDAISHFIEKADLTSPRDIVMAVERYASGLSAESAVQAIDADPVYAQIADATITGHWDKVAPLLRTLKPQDAKGLRQVLGGFLRNSLIAANNTAAASALRELALYHSFEAGIDLGAVVSIIHSYCGKKRG